ncbi:MAG: hypothetical protein VX502_05385 [Candidatus Thermoplasmatota archaeon]|nr:hypothetical protein [Candidatus Thermoplasmatota archaeon]
MNWYLNPVTSQVGESPGDESKIGFRGTRFAISSDGQVFLRDYRNPETNEKIRTYHKDSASYVESVRDVMEDEYWNGRFRIRGNGDTYCVNRNGPGWTYVGRTDLGNTEAFEGYCLGVSSLPGATPDSPLTLFSGTHNFGQVGGRWTITPDWYADQYDALGNVGIRMKKNDWIWSDSNDLKLISSVRSAFKYERSNFLRLYVNCCGWVIRPVKNMFWEDIDAYGIDIDEQTKLLRRKYPMAANSANQRLKRVEEGEEATLYFVCGHIDDMGGLPKPDLDDWRVKNVNQDRGKWG